MTVNTKYRTQETEIMDDFSLQGKELRDALDKIASINRLLGGNKLTLHGIKRLLKIADTEHPINCRYRLRQDDRCPCFSQAFWMGTHAERRHHRQKGQATCARFRMISA